jgi:hypothetical protein
MKWDTTGAATMVLAFATMCAVGVACYQIADAAAARRAQTFLTLRQQYLAVDKDLDPIDRSRPYPENSRCPGWHALKRYWYLTETEWRMAKLDPSGADNWNKSQLPQVLTALEGPSYRSTFLIMGATRFSRGEGAEFVKELETAYRSQVGSDLKFELQKANGRLPLCKAVSGAPGQAAPDPCSCNEVRQ